MNNKDNSFFKEKHMCKKFYCLQKFHSEAYFSVKQTFTETESYNLVTITILFSYNLIFVMLKYWLYIGNIGNEMEIVFS